ncbi:hypothetical protein ACJRO7_033349 [Eucalyptus globulus]|uniref:NTF2 domain-containing protein n=1 Tax=Eucalyptus globulus TaxID=34317 RepID=A0ABD3JQ24_EUCGL
MDPSQGEKTKDLIPKAKGFLKNHFSILEELVELRAEWAEKELAELAVEESAEKKLANLYWEDAMMTFDGENIQGKEAICAKFSSLKLSRIQVLNIECLPVSGNDLNSGFYGMGCGYIWLDGKQDARLFSQTFSLHPTPEGSFAISNSVFIHIGMESCGAGTTLGSLTRPFP